ncbi:acetolactate synthase small subunit [Candidatus Bathyarchaeota archaeon]|nr:MAG: acetolactate synthase small subunit [Candidatus Bathyarchaeota archaeon]RLI04360.1 MAG: acetolactate synthase small subunit [Candidatus Bathyarchaeota archaeon]
MAEKKESYIISTIVEHKPGVLYQVSNMFRRRGFNIETITVGESEQAGLARMTITINGDEKTVEQVVKQLNKLLDVVKVSILDPEVTVTRELALIRINTPNAAVRSDVINYTEIFKGRVVDVAHDSLLVEMTGDSDKITAFIELMRTFGVKEIARTGITALPRGMRSTKLE